LAKKNIPVWIRHVIVPGITDDPEEQKRLGHFIAALPNVKALDVLPYHTMGVNKYKNLGIPYPLEGVEALPKQEAAKAKAVILQSFREERAAMRAHQDV
ncbi:MAG: pyruvate formate-lyase 1-activating enzyme, partial [Clostridia bacterium]|nr:pyruvate formate-lyase 1-activating enzyme [Clostridia bacterium]